MVIPEEHKATIRGLVEADPEVAQATCDIPHLKPGVWLEAGWPGDALPYCGCFVGVYAWMQQCKAGNDRGLLYGAALPTVSNQTGVPGVGKFGGWCNTVARDRLAVDYARSLLE